MHNRDIEIKAIIGLGNPGSRFFNHRHNIGFMVLDALTDAYSAQWQSKDLMELAVLNVNGKKIMLIKPQTFMNNSGKVIPILNKQGIKPENILVVHDELEKPFGHLSISFGGSARGHNGLRSIIETWGKEFARLRFGIGRPKNKEDVGQYVLSSFSEPQLELEELIGQAVQQIKNLIAP